VRVLLHCLFQFFLMVGQQSMDPLVGFVTDGVNLRSKILPRKSLILIEQRLNLVVVFLQQRPDLLLLFRSQFQVFGQVSKFLVDGSRPMNIMAR
jgi:hypothetical protein